MKYKILEIANRLKLETLTTKQAKKELLILLDEHGVLTYDMLEAGDFVFFSRSMSKSVTVGKRYEVVFVSDDWVDGWKPYFIFADDTGKKRCLSKHAKGYRIRMD